MTRVFDTSEEGIAQAVAALEAGALAILPTDTVYGIAASIAHDEAVLGIYAAKGKGERAPLQLLFAPDADLIARYATLTPAARTFIDTVGPGGWTLIVPARPGWSSPALSGGTTVGVRVPAAPIVHDVVRGLGVPLAASSANQHGQPSPRTCAESVSGVGHACAVAVDGGEVGGLDSTVIDLASDIPRILREGAIAREVVADILGLQTIDVLRSVRP